MTDDCKASFFGKYRGQVENPLDPIGIGRLQVSVPDVMGSGTLAWAMPCLPGAGPGVGFFSLPPMGAKIWVEFEGGDPDYPIWSGGFWDIGDAPATIGPTQMLTHVWAGQFFKIEVLDAPGIAELTISVTTAVGDAVLTASATECTLSFGAGKVSLGLDGVTVNNGNLKVLP